MARQPKKASKDFNECPKCGSTLLDVTVIRSGDAVYGREYDCRDCEFAWNDRGDEL